MNKMLNYLKKFLDEPKVLPILNASDMLMSELPEWWQKILLTKNDKRVQKTLQAWEEYQAYLPTVFEFLANYLRSVNLLINKTTSWLLYELEKDGHILYYAGGNPIRKAMSPSVQAIWGKLRADFRKFYDSFHNGWYYLASNSMGPSPTEDFFILNDVEWGILEDIGDPGCDLKDLLAVYSNGMGAYVALSVEQKGTYGDVLWQKDKPPHFNIDAWAVMDAWTEIGLNN